MSHILNLRVSKNGDLHLPVVVFMLTASLLAVVQIKLTNNPLILLERFIPGAGWIEIAAVALYGAFMVFKCSRRMRCLSGGESAGPSSRWSSLPSLHSDYSGLRNF
jgi:hypothetical protein